jgi:hypothetical protein
MVRKTAELLTLYGSGSTNATGTTLALQGDLLYGTVNFIQIPAGLDLKIWAKNTAGAAVTVNYQYSNTASAGGPFRTIATDDLVAAGDFDIEKRRPVIARGTTGLEGIQIFCTQASSGTFYVEFEIEVTDDQLEELLETDS